jgi:sulfite reductase (ferredoxin)
VGIHAATARPVGYRIPATEVPQAVERLLKSYQSSRANVDETLQTYFARHSNEELRAQLAGEIVAPVARDVSAGPAPGTDA